MPIRCFKCRGGTLLSNSVRKVQILGRRDKAKIAWEVVEVRLHLIM